ncbi:hypothetical protein J6590_101091, partial [Homalodisca vitripennis]
KVLLFRSTLISQGRHIPQISEVILRQIQFSNLFEGAHKWKTSKSADRDVYGDTFPSRLLERGGAVFECRRQGADVQLRSSSSSSNPLVWDIE